MDAAQRWLAVIGGLILVMAFVLNRRDAGRVLASRVHVVVVSYRHGPSPEGAPFLNLQVVNGGDAPVFDIGISIWGWDGRRRRLWRLRKHREWMTSKRVLGVVVTAVYAADRSKELELKGLETTPRTLSYRATPLMMVFRDGDGRRWVRWPDGRLSRLYGLERLKRST